MWQVVLSCVFQDWKQASPLKKEYLSCMLHLKNERLVLEDLCIQLNELILKKWIKVRLGI